MSKNCFAMKPFKKKMIEKCSLPRSSEGRMRVASINYCLLNLRIRRRLGVFVNSIAMATCNYHGNGYVDNA